MFAYYFYVSRLYDVYVSAGFCWCRQKISRLGVETGGVIWCDLFLRTQIKCGHFFQVGWKLTSLFNLIELDFYFRVVQCDESESQLLDPELQTENGLYSKKGCHVLDEHWMQAWYKAFVLF